MRMPILFLTLICMSVLGLSVPVFADPLPSTAAHQNQADQVDINTAGLSELKSLKGIGKKLAQRIIDDRKANGPFTSVDDLKRVKGIGKKTVEKNRIRMRVSSPKPVVPPKDQKKDQTKDQK